MLWYTMAHFQFTHVFVLKWVLQDFVYINNDLAVGVCIIVVSDKILPSIHV